MATIIAAILSALATIVAAWIAAEKRKEARRRHASTRKSWLSWAVATGFAVAAVVFAGLYFSKSKVVRNADTGTLGTSAGAADTTDTFATAQQSTDLQPPSTTSAPSPPSISPATEWALQRSLEAADDVIAKARTARTTLQKYEEVMRGNDVAAIDTAAQRFNAAYLSTRAAGTTLQMRYNELTKSDWSAVDGARLNACVSDLAQAGFDAGGVRRARETLQAASGGQVNVHALDLELKGYEEFAQQFTKCMSFAKRR